MLQAKPGFPKLQITKRGFHIKAAVLKAEVLVAGWVAAKPDCGENFERSSNHQSPQLILNTDKKEYIQHTDFACPMSFFFYLMMTYDVTQDMQSC